MTKLNDLTGQTFGRLTVVARVDNRYDRVMWSCVCSCGATLTVQAHALRVGKCSSCGCLQREITSAASIKHGRSRSSIYYIWCGMRSRCSNKSNKSYPDYGGRGITVCERWNSFENFLADMGEKPHGMSLERKDNNLGYCKENCVWASREQQASNRRSNATIEFNGEVCTYAEWGRRLGGSAAIVSKRIRQGWDPIKAITTPIRKSSPHSSSP